MKNNSQKANVLYDEIVEHAIQGNILTQRYFPRTDILEQVSRFFLKLILINIIQD